MFIYCTLCIAQWANTQVSVQAAVCAQLPRLPQLQAAGNRINWKIDEPQMLTLHKLPMAALVAIMLMVAIGTFSWSSVKNLKSHPWSSSAVMIATVAGVLLTHNLAIGVLIGVALSAVFFAWKVSNIFKVESALTGDGRARVYTVQGQLFFASSEDFLKSFDFKEAPDHVTIDMSRAHVWDISSVQAVDLAVMKFRREGTEVALVGMNEASKTLVDRLGVHDRPDADTALPGH